MRDVFVRLHLRLRDGSKVSNRQVRAYMKEAACGCVCYLPDALNLSPKIKSVACTWVALSDEREAKR